MAAFPQQCVTVTGQLVAVGNVPFVEVVLKAGQGAANEYSLAGETPEALSVLQLRHVKVTGILEKVRGRYTRQRIRLQSLTILYPKTP